MEADFDPDLVDLLPAFLERTRNAIAASFDGDFAATRKVGHNLKGTAATFGFPRLGDLGHQLEAAAQALDESAVLRLRREISGELRAR
ncbi:MAG: Hpt domain-containing protein [Deltaproteobacteria bacterium]|nr:Hpt domain-containing protein [Deltaproteobacteria bacterium]